MTDTGIKTIEALSFPALITSLSAGPQPGDLALGFADGSGAVVVNGAETVRLAAQSPSTRAPEWVPASDWVLYARDAGNSGGASRVRRYIVAAAGGSPTALPACATSASVAQDAVAWWCGSTLSILTLPAHGEPSVSGARSYKLNAPGGSPPKAFAVDPQTGQLAVAVGDGVDIIGLTGNGDVVSVGGSSSVSETPLWSPTGTLAAYSPTSVTLWSRRARGSLTVTFPATGFQAVQWLPGGQSLLAADLANPGQLPAAETVDVLGADGSLVRRMAGRMGYLLGFGTDGTLMWRQEGVAPGVFSSGAAGAGTGPFRLEAVPVSQTALAGRASVLTGGALGTMNLTSFQMATANSGWASDGARIYHTSRAGAAWTDVTPEVTLPGGDDWQVQSLGAEAALVTTTLYTSGYPPATDTVMVSGDAGRSWRRVPSPYPSFAPYSITGSDPQHLWAWSSTPSGTTIYATGDGGTHWSPVTPQGLPDGALANLAFEDAETGWASGRSANQANGMWLAVTHDGGGTWTPSSLPPVPGLPGNQTIAGIQSPKCFDANTCVLGVILAGAQERADVYTSTDGGDTWTPSAPSPPTPPQNPNLILATADATHWFALVGKQLFGTDDAGGSWRQLPVPGVVSQVSALQFLDRLHGWLATPSQIGGLGAIWQTDNGGATWSPDYPAEPPPARHDASAFGEPVMVTPTQGWWIGDASLAHTIDGGTTWTDVSPPDLGAAGSLPSSNDVSVTGATSASVALHYPGAPVKVWRTTDGGATWQGTAVAGTVSDAVPEDLGYSNARDGWLLVNQAPCGGTEQALFRTDDGGAHWTEVPQSPSSKALPYLTTLWFNSATTGYASTSSLMVTHDGGSTWQDVALPSTPFTQPVAGSPSPYSVIYTHFFDDQHAVVAVTSRTNESVPVLIVFRTADGGNTWTAGQALYPSPFPSAQWRAPWFSDPMHGWVYDGGSLDVTSDGGASWHRVVGVGAQTLTSLAYHDGGSGTVLLSFASPSRGVASLGTEVLSTTDGGQTWHELAAQFEGTGWADVSAPIGTQCACTTGGC